MELNPPELSPPIGKIPLVGVELRGNTDILNGSRNINNISGYSPGASGVSKSRWRIRPPRFERLIK